jgi:predicted ester cyclase
MNIDDAKALAVRSIHIMGNGTLDDFHEVCHPEFLNHEAKDEPPAARERGPAGCYATALWLRGAFEDLRWEIGEVIAEGDLVVVHCTMKGRHTRVFVDYDEDANVGQAFPATGRTFASTQTHWLRIVDGKVIEHWANRDDLGTALQLGWVPPTPLYLARALFAKRKAARLQAAAA